MSGISPRSDPSHFELFMPRPDSIRSAVLWLNLAFRSIRVSTFGFFKCAPLIFFFFFPLQDSCVCMHNVSIFKSRSRGGIWGQGANLIFTWILSRFDSLQLLQRLLPRPILMIIMGKRRKSVLVSLFGAKFEKSTVQSLHARLRLHLFYIKM